MASAFSAAGGRQLPRIFFFGDPHGDLDTVIQAVERGRPAAVVLLGDIQARRPLDVELAPILGMTEVWYIHGNHDTDSQADCDNLWRSGLADRNLHGRVVDVAGLKIAGLGGVFRGKIWDPAQPIASAPFYSAQELMRHTLRQKWLPMNWREGITLKHRSSIFPDEYEAMQGAADILVTHEAPSFHPYGFAAIDALAARLGVGMIVNGHQHEDVDYAARGWLPAASPFKAFGVNKGSYLAIPEMALHVVSDER